MNNEKLRCTLTGTDFIFACVAQLVVQLIRNEQVAGSSPVTSTKKAGYHALLFFLSIALYTLPIIHHASVPANAPQISPPRMSVG